MIEIKNQKVIDWVNECASLTKPKEILWIDGSSEQLEALRKEACETGELIKLNEEKLPGCYYYRTDPKDVARDEKRTVIATERREDAGPTNNWVQKDEMYAKMRTLFDGSMKGRTMYVIPYSMGVVGSEFAKIGIEITDSIYVVLNMNIMTRIGDPVIEELNKGADFIKCLHSKAEVNAEKKYIAHFPEDDTIWSINSAYGGNVLLGKKCFALRIGSWLGRKEGWMAEHMLILCIEAPNGEKKYISAAFPSACGKTNLAMLIPPKHLQEKGYKVYTIGDDIAWLRVGADGRLYAVNPENGFFGVAPGTNSKSNNNALMTTKKNTIYTNVCRNLDDNTVWWEGLDQPAPTNGEDWLGRPWNGENAAEKGAHPNSRFTAPAENCPSIAPEFFTGEGVPISAIIFGGRRAKAEPLICQSRDWNHGVFLGSKMSSETTAAANGAVGVVRYDPMAMLPFCGYNMSDYFQHWIDMGKKMTNPPKIFNVNWFRKDDEGHFIWPGFGDNLRALLWALDRCDGKADAVETPLGYVPTKDSLDLEGLDLTDQQLDELLTVDRETWKKELEGIKEWYAKLGRLPKELTDSLERLENEL
ncbi:MAG: phosphoenolpyruvate carboxykinase (GTP) [Firmicutes bacterium]|nr:phosphoenolpyruvate carboxykinase (GTP) [Bacillota bacterium]MDY5770670.1 phosphoenolpyruvate carboxykinase (GTP) [Anaerovoracaceae bacterium]